MIELWQRIDALLPPGCNLKWLCDEAGVSYKKILNLRHRNRPPSLDILYKFAQIFGTTMDFIYSGKEPYYNESTITDDYDKNRKALEDIVHILLKNKIIEK